jgi:gluconolactonase
MNVLKMIRLVALAAIVPVLCVLGIARAASTDISAGIISTPLQIDLRSPSLDRIVPAHAELERIATGFTWTEGPVWLDGSLFFSDIPSDSIRRWTPGRGVSIFLQPSGFLSKPASGWREIGSDGNTVDARGRLTVAGHAQRDVYRLESLAPHAQITILADTYQGKRFNSPNDLVYRSDGSLYFTDPPYGLPTQSDSDPGKQLKVNGVYRIAHALQHKPGAPPDRGAVELLIGDMTRPNGIAFSPDEKFLYVNNSEPLKQWLRYRVLPDGRLTDKKLLYDATSDPHHSTPDGMRVDEEGNIYSAGPGGVWIFNADGKPLGRILMPEVVANVAWGGADRRTLYITASTSVYRVRLKIAGEPVVRQR